MISFFYQTSLAVAQVELPPMPAPVIETPKLPQIPVPKIPEVKLIDTDKISREIEKNARIKESEDKKTAKEHNDDKSDSKTTQAHDKIRDNKYIKRDKSTEGTKQNINGQQAAVAQAAQEKAATAKKIQQPDAADNNVSASELLKANFFAVMFYIFSKTSLAAIIFWAVFLAVNKHKSVAIDTVVFFAMNIIGSMIYFSFVAKMENNIWRFAGKTVAAKEFSLLIIPFAGCMLVIAVLISVGITLWKRKSKI